MWRLAKAPANLSFQRFVSISAPIGSTRSLEDVYLYAKKSNDHLRVAHQIYTQGARLPQNVERTYLLDLIADGQVERAISLWETKSLKNKRFWRSTGVLLKCKINDIAGAEALASQGVHHYAEAEIAKAHARSQNVSEALQWLKGCSPKQREPVMEALASNAINYRKISEPSDLALLLTSTPSILKDSSAVLRGLSGSRVKLVDNEFWQKNHHSKTRSELLRQGLVPKKDSGLTTERCLTLLNNAISDCNHELADEIYNQRPTTQYGNRELQLELRYFQFKSDYAAAFNRFDPPSRTINMLNWSLIWSIMRSFSRTAFPNIVAPDQRELYKSMIKTRGIHVSPKTINNIIEVFLRDGDFSFLLSILSHWMNTSARPLPSQSINFLSQRSDVPVHSLREYDADKIIEALCEAYGASFEEAKRSKYLF